MAVPANIHEPARRKYLKRPAYQTPGSGGGDTGCEIS
jgi:hypothetical protein